MLKSNVRCIYTFINGFSDTLMDNSNLAMLSIQPRKWIITLHNNYCSTCCSISYKHNILLLLVTRNSATASILNFAQVTTVLNWCKLFWAHTKYTFITNNKHQHWDLILAAMSILNAYIIHDLNGLDSYTSYTVHEQDSVVARHEKINYTCSHALQHVTRYVHIFLA